MLPLLLPASGITVGPASLSMPELAEALTKAGMAVEATPPLRSRGAFVCLKDRSPEQVRKLLGEALGIAFEPRQGRFLMVPDPAVQARDRKLVQAYRRLASREIRAWISNQQAKIGNRRYPEFAAWVQKTIAAIQGTTPSKEAIGELLWTSTLLEPARWNVIHRPTLSSTLPQTLEGPREEWSTLAQTGLPPEVYSQDGEVPAPETPLRFRLSFIPTDAAFRVDDVLLVDGGERAGGKPTAVSTGQVSYVVNDSENGVQIAIERGGTEAAFREMGPDAEAYLASLSPRPELSSDRPLPDPAPKHISLALERFGHEAVMELSPRFEDVPRAWLWQTPGALTPKTLFTPVPPALFPALDVRDALAGETRDRAMRLRGERRFPMRPIDRDGVWVVVNPYAFLDRVQPISPVPFLRAERILREVPRGALRDFGGNLMPTWDMVVRLYRAVRPETTLKGTQESFNYRDVSLYEPSLLEPLVPLIESLPPARREAFWTALREEKRAALDDGDGPIEVKVRPFARSKEDKGGFTLEAVRLVPGHRLYNITAFIDGRGSILP